MSNVYELGTVNDLVDLDDYIKDNYPTFCEDGYGPDIARAVIKAWQSVDPNISTQWAAKAGLDVEDDGSCFGVVTINENTGGVQFETAVDGEFSQRDVTRVVTKWLQDDDDCLRATGFVAHITALEEWIGEELNDDEDVIDHIATDADHDRAWEALKEHCQDPIKSLKDVDDLSDDEATELEQVMRDNPDDPNAVWTKLKEDDTDPWWALYRIDPVEYKRLVTSMRNREEQKLMDQIKDLW